MKQLDRATYKAIKSMNREQIEKLFTNIYNEGIAAAGGSKVTYEAIEEKIKAVPGIGEKRLKQIMESLSSLFEKEN